jgi:hypothetical protein
MSTLVKNINLKLLSSIKNVETLYFLAVPFLKKNAKAMRTQTLDANERRICYDRCMVKNITEYGAFIDLGGMDGFLHITDMSWGRM